MKKRNGSVRSTASQVPMAILLAHGKSIAATGFTTGLNIATMGKGTSFE
jgi:hypothetical protein